MGKNTVIIKLHDQKVVHIPVDSTQKPNNLINETSPYLLQHAYNPVNWYPWGQEAFSRAKAEDKPIFLSIGYSTCHWCHVMEKESFEDQEVADVLNRGFIAVKVDREERPDIDSVYMSVCQVMTGGGGWPTTIIMTPDQKPFFAGTYLPKRSRYGTTGLLELLDIVLDRWDNHREELISASDKVTNMIRLSVPFSSSNVNSDTVKTAFQSFKRSFDTIYGGFGDSPKFPSAHNLTFLMHYYKHTKDENALKMVEKTLYQMYKGGIFDHIGGGFSRYSTDRMWLVPHFEKMLYDNALLVMAYLDAYQLTGNELYKDISLSVMKYVIREMQDVRGGFYCAQDADSEGEEGKYYTFTKDEIIELLGKEDGTRFCRHYNITEVGNFERKKNIPNRLVKVCSDDLSAEELSRLNDEVYKYRSSRTYLAKDDKILMSWTALMAVAFARAYRVLGDDGFLETAESAVEFIANYMFSDKDKLFSSYRNGKASTDGHLDDYAFYAWALTELYECTFDPSYIHRAVRCVNYMREHFLDRVSGGFFLTDSDSESLIIRPKETYDGAMPSGNSVAAYTMYKLSEITGDVSMFTQFHEQLDFMSPLVSLAPSGHTFALLAFMSTIYPTTKVVAVVQSEDGLTALRETLSEQFVPDMTLAVKNTSDVQQDPEFLSSYIALNDDDTYYVCKGNACLAPFNGVENLSSVLDTP